jgi:hypothetical protein
MIWTTSTPVTPRILHDHDYSAGGGYALGPGLGYYGGGGIDILLVLLLLYFLFGRRSRI